MSRIGRLPIEVPAGVEVKIDGSYVKVKGPKGELEWTFSPDIVIKEDGIIVVERPSDQPTHRSCTVPAVQCSTTWWLGSARALSAFF